MRVGLNESAGPNQYAYPADLMSGYPMPGSFAAAHVAALRFTAGRQGDPDPDLLLALGVYETNWDFSTGPPRTPVDGPGSASPNAVQSAAPNGPSASPVTPDQPAATATPNEPSTATVAPPLTSTVDVMPGQAATLESGPVAATLAATPSKTYDQLTVEYVVNQNPYNYPITLRVYRSQQKEYDRDNPEQVMIVDVQLLPKDSENGKHTITVSMDGDYQFIDDGSGLPALRPDPTHEFVITTLDDDGALNPHDVYNTPQTEFRIWLVAAVAHGFTARGVDAASTILNQGSLLVTNSNFFSTDTVPWVDPMVSALMDNNYDYALPVHWEKLSNKNEPISGGELAALRGYQLALEIAGMLPDKDVTSHLDGFDPEKDIVDVHFIGHSRGTVIISQALMDLNGSNTVFENYNLDNVPRWLKNGFQLMTLLDPHPANNEYSKLDRNKSLDKNALSSLVAFGTTKFQSEAQDDIVVVPSNVWAAEDYYQKTAAKDAPGNENIVNLWGLSVDELEDESYVTIQEHNVTGNGIGHGEVVDDIYRAIVDQGTDENDFPYTLLALGLTPFGADSGPMAHSLAIDAGDAPTSDDGPATAAATSNDDATAATDGTSSFAVEADPPSSSEAAAPVNPTAPLTWSESYSPQLPPVTADVPAAPTRSICWRPTIRSRRPWRWMPQPPAPPCSRWFPLASPAVRSSTRSRSNTPTTCRTKWLTSASICGKAAPPWRRPTRARDVPITRPSRSLPRANCCRGGRRSTTFSPASSRITRRSRRAR